ncbi:hypothetical protein B0T24DRAFT_300307 [Lasiosphaeria ovina]|uniref:C2H2-type domain-containing protein n=1 Tax=Lasiosphaeria ovina TaxID=92902 RepID=A0AAE0K747_9PEZI|nr:hypothetical protein B0T24DRAFT_300307 [Lasiosphaeria ovina]
MDLSYLFWVLRAPILATLAMWSQARLLAAKGIAFMTGSLPVSLAAMMKTAKSCATMSHSLPRDAQWAFALPSTASIPVACLGAYPQECTCAALLERYSYRIQHISVFSGGKPVAVWVQQLDVSALLASPPHGNQVAKGKASGSRVTKAQSSRSSRGRGKGNAKATKGRGQHQDSPSDDNDNDNDNDNGSDPEDPEGPEGPGDAVIEPRRGRNFACPFYKFNPHDYQNCCTKKLKTFPHVLQHIERCHFIPAKPRYFEYCACCFDQFEHETDWLAHSRTCQVQLPKPEKILRSERSLLETDATLTPPRRWFQLWDQVFAGHARPLSPYVDPGILEMIGLFRVQGEALLAARMGTLLQRHNVPSRLVPDYWSFAQDVADLIFTAPANSIAGPVPSRRHPPPAPEDPAPVQEGFAPDHSNFAPAYEQFAPPHDHDNPPVADENLFWPGANGAGAGPQALHSPSNVFLSSLSPLEGEPVNAFNANELQADMDWDEGLHLLNNDQSLQVAAGGAQARPDAQIGRLDNTNDAPGQSASSFTASG